MRVTEIPHVPCARTPESLDNPWRDRKAEAWEIGPSPAESPFARERNAEPQGHGARPEAAHPSHIGGWLRTSQ